MCLTFNDNDKETLVLVHTNVSVWAQVEGHKMKTHYDAIPSTLLQGTILDVGCGDGSNQRISKNWPLLQHATGIDIDTDLFKYEPPHLFDTVLAIHVIEHIDKEKWFCMFDRLCSWVKPNGYLIIGTPHKQDPRVYRKFKGPENQRHRVFDIDEELIESYLGPVIAWTYKGPYSQSFMCIWRKQE